MNHWVGSLDFTGLVRILAFRMAIEPAFGNDGNTG